MYKKSGILKVLTYLLACLLLVSVFKNISYPLLWADESMTAMGSERVVKFGYPKAHDGKNVVNDMFCGTPRVAVNVKDDAFIGGANWGQYYFGAIGYKLANGGDDLYAKTGIFRSTFALIGLLGLFILAFAVSKFFNERLYRRLFWCLFPLAELISISMALHLKEVRYYSPALFFSSLIISMHIIYRFHIPFNKIFYSIGLTILLWIVFNMFSPLYFIFRLAIGISEGTICVFGYWKTKKIKETFIATLPAFAAIAISYTCVYPLLGYFKTFEMKKILDDFYHFNSSMYWWHFSSAVRYFGKLELMWLAVAMRIGVMINYNKALSLYHKQFSVSNFLTLLFIVFLFSVPNIDSPMFTRYLIYMQPVVAIIAVIDFIVLLNIFTKNEKIFWNQKTAITVAVFAGLFGFAFFENLPFIEGHVYEMTNQYKGPLDYTIPFIKVKYPNTENLTIATNYEETSYMYYLKSKVIVGFVGNNLPEDTAFTPDLISYRQSLGSNFEGVFNYYLKKAQYTRTPFLGKDIPLNNIPELNFDRDVFNHRFKSETTDDERGQESLLIKM